MRLAAHADSDLLREDVSVASGVLLQNFPAKFQGKEKLLRGTMPGGKLVTEIG